MWVSLSSDHQAGMGPDVRVGPGDNAPMLTDPAVLIGDFSAAAGELGIDGWPCGLHGEVLLAPHRQAALWPGFGAVYAFALSARTTSAAGAGMVLKVGKVGPNSDARFRSQHYTTVRALHLGKEPSGTPDTLALAGHQRA